MGSEWDRILIRSYDNIMGSVQEDLYRHLFMGFYYEKCYFQRLHPYDTWDVCHGISCDIMGT